MMSDLNAAKEALLREGGHLNHRRVTGALAKAEQKAHDEAAKLTAPPNKQAAEWIVTLLGWLAVAFFFVVLLIGTGALLVIIPAAEAAAVYEGLFLITPIPTIAGLTTAALFVGTIVLMFLKNVFEDALPNGRPQTGLRRIVGGLGRWIGHRKLEALDTAPSYTSIEYRYLLLTRALNFAKFAILFASLVGRLKTSITAHADQTVGEFWQSLQTQLTGQELIGAVVSLLVLFAILRILDVGVLFAYSAFKNSAGKIDLAETKPMDFLEAFSVLSERYQAEALNDLTMELRVLNERKDSNEPSQT
jgi:hypothetical protein